MSERFFREIFFKSGGVSKLRMEDAPRPRHSEPRVPRTCLSKHRCLRTSSRPRRYAVAPPPSVRSSPRAGRPTLREIFEATPDWASYKRGMRSPRTPRARASRLDRALTSPPRSNTQAIQAAKGYVHFRGSSLVRPPRPRFTGGSGTKTPRARSAPTARRTRCSACRCARENFPPRVSQNTQTLPPDRRPPFPRAQDTVTSMIIPMGFAAAGLTLLVKGIDDLRWGKNRKEGF